MSLSRSCSLLALLPLLAAQSLPPTLTIDAPISWVLAARNLPLEATLTGEFGEILTGVNFSWSSSNPEIAAVSGNGVVSGLLPGIAVIEASAAGVSARYAVTVHPARIDIAPSRLEVEAGERASFTVRALDADGRPLPPAPVLWSSPVPTVATVDASGAVLAVGPGAVTLTARLDLPQSGIGFSGSAHLIVRPRAPYRITSAFSSDPGPVSIKAIHTIDYASASGNDRFAFLASVSNGGQALMLSSNGQLRKILATGDTLSGLIVASIANPSINARGDVLALVTPVNAPPWAALFPFDKPTEPYLEPQPSGGPCCMQLSSGTLADNGDFLLSYYNGASGYNADEIYLARAGAAPTLIPTSNLPTLGKANWIRGSAAHPAGPGRFFFGAGSPGRSGIFLWDGRQIVKALATNDAVLTRSVDWVNTNSFAASPSGELYAYFGGPNYQRLARWSAGSWTNIVESGQQIGGFTIFYFTAVHSARDSSVLFEANTDKGAGLFLFANGQLQRLLTGNPQGPFLYFRQAFLRPDGDPIVFGPSPVAHARISRFATGSESILLESGRDAGFRAPIALDWTSLFSAAGSASSLLARAPSSAVVRVAASSPQILLSPGDTLSPGVFADSIPYQAAATNGDLFAATVTTQGDKMYVFRQQTRTEIRLELPAGEEFMGYFNRIAAGPRGHIAACIRVRNTASGNWSERLVTFTESNRLARTITITNTPAPGGGVYNWIEQLAVDPDGRIWFVSNPNNGSTLYLWENGAARRLHSSADPLPDGRRFNGFGTLMLSAGKAYSQTWFPGSGPILLETDGNRLRPFLTGQDPLSYGPTATGYVNNGLFRLAPNGDLSFFAWLSSAFPSLIVRTPDGSDKAVAARYARLGPNGPWALDFLDAAWTSDNRLFFTAYTQGAASRVDLFIAAPQ